MQDWTPDDRARAARRRDRASRAVAAVGVVATAGTVAATLGLASALTPPPAAGPAPATSVSSASPAGPRSADGAPADQPPVATTRQELGSLALRGPDKPPRERTARPKRPAVPRTSGS